MVLRRSPSSILAFIGTATLVAGAALNIDAGCLTDPDKCTIILSRNTPAGTLGFLSAPTSGRSSTDTNFDIASSNAADTSTVNWMAIPKNVGSALSTTFVNNASLRRGPSGLNVHRGRATLVGGTVTVTGIAFRAGAIGFCMAATFGGTSGKLSIPSATVLDASGSFVINSSSGTDTSTVDWVIVGNPLRFSPSGSRFAQSKGTLSSSTQFTNMNPLDDTQISVLASVINPSSPANLSAPTIGSNRSGGLVTILSSDSAGDGSLVEVAVF